LREIAGAFFFPAEGIHPSLIHRLSGQIIQRMRINLVTPFAEKDAVKALGARWDATKKLWYIVDVTDLTPFLRWIPNVDTAMVGSNATESAPKSGPPKAIASPAASVNQVPHCGCDVLPWDDCVHTAKT
jgi:hypothetical protein